MIQLIVYVIFKKIIMVFSLIFNFIIIDPIKIQMLKEIIKIINKTSEDKLPDKFIDVVNLIEFDTKAEKVLKLEADQKKENVFAIINYGKNIFFRKKLKENILEKNSRKKIKIKMKTLQTNKKKLEMKKKS